MVGARIFLRILAPLQLQQFPNHKGANNGCDKLNRYICVQIYTATLNLSNSYFKCEFYSNKKSVICRKYFFP